MCPHREHYLRLATILDSVLKKGENRDIYMKTHAFNRLGPFKNTVSNASDIVTTNLNQNMNNYLFFIMGNKLSQPWWLLL